MQSWQDMAVFYADSTALEQMTPPPKSITYADLAIQEPNHPAFRCALTTTDLVIPQFIHLERRHLLAIGGSPKRICSRN
jgi:hypothetical protein